MARSPTQRSSRPMATGSSVSPTGQTPSHWFSCGQTRPQMAGRRVGAGMVSDLIAHPAFQPPDGHGLERLADRADAFALVFLRTDAPADGGQEVGRGDGVVSAAVVLGADLRDEPGNVDAHGTAFDAGGVGTEQTALRFPHRILEGCPVS